MKNCRTLVGASQRPSVPVQVLKKPMAKEPVTLMIKVPQGNVSPKWRATQPDPANRAMLPSPPPRNIHKYVIINGTSPKIEPGGNRVACVMNACRDTQQNQGNHDVCPELRTTDLIPQVDTLSMNTKKAESESLCTKAPVTN